MLRTFGSKYLRLSNRKHLRTNREFPFETLEARDVLDSTVVFNEVMFQPAADEGAEWIELHNQMAVDMDLSGWRIDGGVRFDFPEGTVVPGQGYAVVAADPSKFGETLPDSTLLLGPFDGRLSNGGEDLRLLNNIDSFVTRTAPNANLPDRYWSVDLQGQGGVIANPNPPLMSDADSSSGLGNIWNEANVAGHRGTSQDPVFSNLVDQLGNETSVEFSIQGTVSGWANRNGDALIDDYLFVNAGNAERTANWTISGLTPNATYELYAFGGVARDALLSVDNDGNGLEDNDASQFIVASGNLFESITASPNGTIVGSIEPGNSGEANWSGFHLIEGTLNKDDVETPPTVLSGNEGRRVMDRMEFRADQESPIAPFGSGVSLAKKSVNLGSADRANWTSSVFTGGTPGSNNENQLDQLPKLAFNELSSAAADDVRVELYNFGDETISLDGMLVTSANHAEEFVLSGSLAPGQFFVFGEAELGFSVNDGQELFLYGNANRTFVLDAVRFGDANQARRPDGSGRWLVPNALTFGSGNTFNLRDEIVINEIQYHGYPDRGTPDVPPEFEQTIVLPIDATWRYNRNLSNEGLPADWAMTAHPVDGQSWMQGPGLLGATNRPDRLPVELKTDFGNLREDDPRITTFYFETEFDFTGDPSSIDLQLNTVIDDGAVFYLNGAEVLRQNMPSGPIDPLTRATPAVPQPTFSGPKSISIDKLVVGTNRLSVEVHQSTPSSSDLIFGTIISFRTQITDLIPGEPFRDNDEEWVELFNRSSESVDLSEWKLAGGADFDFSEGTVISAGGYALVVNDRDSFLASRPELSDLVVGEFDGTLSNKSDSVRLVDDVGNPVDQITYFDGGRWPSSPDAGGATLELRNPNADNSIPKLGRPAMSRIAANGKRIPSWSRDR